MNKKREYHRLTEEDKQSILQTVERKIKLYKSTGLDARLNEREVLVIMNVTSRGGLASMEARGESPARATDKNKRNYWHCSQFVKRDEPNISSAA